jgi:DNA-binding response OmpR family regulator
MIIISTCIILKDKKSYRTLVIKLIKLKRSSESITGTMEKSLIDSQLRRPRILLVDDEPDILLTIKLSLVDNGFDVDAYDKSRLALINFKPKFYDLLLTDIRMPELNGLELYKKIRKKDSRIKVCFITAFVDYYRSIAENFNLNLNCFIRKPITIKCLVKHLNTELGSLS